MAVIELGRLPNLRKLIIPDPGYTVVDMDLDRADIQIVAWDSGDENLKAKLKAERDDPTLDLHTSNAIELFGDGSSDKRKLAKIVAHAADYLVSPGTLSAQTGIPKARCAEFLAKWYSMYPGILSWHRRVEHQLQTTRMVTNKFGYRHVFFDRLDRALPEAVAWIPQCLTLDHEVLTESGWKTLDKVIENEPIMVVDKDQSAWFETPMGWVKEKATELMQASSNSYQLQATLQHKVPYRNAGEPNMLLKEISKLPSQAKIPVVCEFEGGVQSLEPELITLMCAIQADGCLDYKRQSVSFEFKKERKIARLEEALKALELPYTKTQVRRGATCFYIPNNKYWYKFQDWKYFDSWLLNYDSDTLHCFLNEIQYWDGWKEPQGGITFSSSIKSNVEWVKTVAHLCGYKARQDKTDARGLRPVYRTAYQNKKPNISWPSVSKVHVVGNFDVMCPTVSTGMFLVRYKDTISVTGNSVVGLIINKAMLNIMRNLSEVQVLLQVHDSLTMQVRTEALGRLLPAIRRESMIPVPYQDPLTIPVGFSLSNKSWGEVLAARVNNGVVEVEVNKQWVLFNPKEH